MQNRLFDLLKGHVSASLSIRPSQGARGEQILDGGGGRGRRESSLPFSLPSSPFSPERPDTQATFLPPG